MVIGGFSKMVIGSSFRATLSKSDQARPFDFQAVQGTSTERFLPRRFAELESRGGVIGSNYPPLSDSDQGRSSFQFARSENNETLKCPNHGKAE